MSPSTTARYRAAGSALGILLLVNASAAPDPNNAKVDKLFAQWDRKDSPGAAIVVVKDGAVVYQHGYGYANLEHGIPITPRTRFDVASVAKQFTGLSVAMLVEQGKLSLDDDVRNARVTQRLRKRFGLRAWCTVCRTAARDDEYGTAMANALTSYITGSKLLQSALMSRLRRRISSERSMARKSSRCRHCE